MPIWSTNNYIARLLAVLHQFYTSDDEKMTGPPYFNTQHKNNQHFIFQCHAVTFTFFTYLVTKMIVGV